jgi:hypothetical protein
MAWRHSHGASQKGLLGRGMLSVVVAARALIRCDNKRRNFANVIPNVIPEPLMTAVKNLASA